MVGYPGRLTVSSAVGQPLKPVGWVGRPLEELKALPREVQREAGFALLVAQEGGRHINAKPLKGIDGASVLEIVEDYDRKTYRVVYWVGCPNVVFVLTAFTKKSTRGIETPKRDKERIVDRHGKARHFCRQPTDDLRAAAARYVVLRLASRKETQ